MKINLKPEEITMIIDWYIDSTNAGNESEDETKLKEKLIRYDRIGKIRKTLKGD